MALSDLISRPIAAPLEGFDKAVGVGFELAQKQDQLRIAQEELALRQDQIQSEYLSKGINALGGLSKAKGPARKMMATLIESYFTKGGLRINKDALTFISSDDTNIDLVAEVSKAMKEKNPAVQKAILQKVLGADAEELPELLKTIDVMAQAEARANIEGFKAGELRAREAEKFQAQSVQTAKENIAKAKNLPISVMRKAATLPVQQQADYITTYESGIGGAANNILDNIKDIRGANPKKAAQIVTLTNQARNMYSTSPEKAASSLETAQTLFAELQAESAKKEARQPAPVNIPKELSTIRKEANAALKDDIAAVRAADDIISLADKSGAITAGMILGKMQILREGKVSVLREGEYDRALKEQGIIDRVNVLFERYGNKKGEALGPTARAEYKRLATDFKRAVLSAVGERSQPYLESARAFGASDDQIKKQIFSPQLHPYIFPKAKDLQKQAFFPTPTGEAPEAQAQQPKTTGKKRWSLKAYKQKNPNLTEDQYNRAKEMAAQSGREVIE